MDVSHNYKDQLYLFDPFVGTQAQKPRKIHTKHHFFSRIIKKIFRKQETFEQQEMFDLDDVVVQRPKKESDNRKFSENPYNRQRRGHPDVFKGLGDGADVSLDPEERQKFLKSGELVRSIWMSKLKYNRTTPALKIVDADCYVDRDKSKRVRYFALSCEAVYDERIFARRSGQIRYSINLSVVASNDPKQFNVIDMHGNCWRVNALGITKENGLPRCGVGSMQLILGHLADLLPTFPGAAPQIIGNDRTDIAEIISSLYRNDKLHVNIAELLHVFGEEGVDLIETTPLGRSVNEEPDQPSQVTVLAERLEAARVAELQPRLPALARSEIEQAL